MKPVAIIQHDSLHRPGVLLDVLRSRGLTSRVFRPDEGDAPRVDAGDFSGMVLLGSYHNASDEKAWMTQELSLIGDALRLDVPVFGHSFGGHQLARAMGADIHRTSHPNIGWSALHVTPGGRSLFDDASKVMGFNWHRETFSLPEGATRTLFGTYTRNEGYAFGRHLAFQCHLDVTPAMMKEWCEAGRSELRHADGWCAQSESDILVRMPVCMPLLQRTAQGVYGNWLSGIQLHAPAK